MKDMLSKGHYCYKIHASLMKNSIAAPPPLPSLVWITSNFYIKILSWSLSAILWFFKNLNPPVGGEGGGGSHYVLSNLEDENPDKIKY